MRYGVAIALPCLILATQARVARTQTPSPPAQQIPTLSSESTLVVVPALVRNRAGELIFALNVDDFILADDGIPQKLTLEQDTGGEPLVLVVLIEAGAATKSVGWHPNAPDSPPDRFSTLPTMIEAMAGNVPHEIAVVGFDSGPELLQDFTTNMDSVADTIRDLCANIDGDGGAAILDSLGFALDLLGKQPRQYRRAILLLSETNDRGSKLKLDDALRAVSDTNTAIYSIAYSTGNTDAAQYAHRELPTKSKPCKADDQLCALLIEMENSHNIAERIVGVTLKTSFYSVRLENDIPNPPHGCMGKDLNPAPNASRSKFSQFYDCLGQLAPPLLIARVAVIETTEGLQRNIPETVAHLTGGEYFKLSDAKSLEQSLATISNHIPNRYVLSFQPQSPHPGFHFITLELPNHVDLQVSARNGYWADTTASSTAPHP